MQVLKAKNQDIFEKKIKFGDGGKRDTKTTLQYLEQYGHKDRQTGQWNKVESSLTVSCE